MTTLTAILPAISLPRTVRLARFNAILMLRNRLAMVYALVLPLTPLALLFGGSRGDAGTGAAAVITTLLFAVLFPVYYNLLSQFVTRRDELVLKRLRTGETRDLELLGAMALPGVAVALVVAALTIPIAMALGQDAPLNLVVYAATVVLASLLFVAFAFWTAAWTRNAEAAQMTSMPVILLAVLGQVSLAFPEEVRRWVDLTPGAALTDLVRVGWFGFGGDDTERTLDLAGTWAASGQSLLVLVAWTALAVWLAARSMQWEPRT
jgi:ABC-2 type transport system permease protein